MNVHSFKVPQLRAKLTLAKSSLGDQMQLGYPYPKRVKLLTDLSTAKTGKTHGIRFQGKFQYINIHTVPLELPKYRLKNGRTAAAQIEYLATHPKVARDIFLKDPESQEAQQIQHSILKTMVNEEGLYDYFKDHEQELPLILTNTGYIVNGNRRVCAMRELHASNENDYQRFKNIDVVVLPPCDEQEIDWLEGKEQIHKDITADYSWATTAVMYRTRMAEHNQKITYVANLYEVKKGEVEAMLDMLVHAEAYLRDRGKEGQYSQVRDDEYAFRQLRKYRSQLKNEARKEVYDQLSYAIIDKPEGDRTYKAVADAANYFDKIVQTIQAEFEVSTKSSSQAGARLLGGARVAQPTAILTILRDSTKRDKVREVLREAIAAENEKTREKQKKNYLYAQVKKAKGALDDALQALGKNSSRDGIAILLDEIERSIKKIRQWLLNGQAKS